MSVERCAAGALCATALFTGACTVGPRYHPPKIVVPTGFKEDAPSLYASLPSGTWRPASPRDGELKGAWWTIFGDAELDALEAELDTGNQSIAIAFHNFMAARAQVDQARAAYFPTVTVGASVNKTGTFGTGSSGGAAPATTTTTGGGTFSGGSTTFSVPVEATWSPDLWGRVRNAVRASRYAAQVSAADLVNVRLVQHATLATLYFELRGQDALVDLYERTIRAETASLELTRAQFETGIGLEQAVAQASSTLANARAAAIGLATARAIDEHAIATLIGKPASALSLPHRALTASPPAIPVAIPSEILQRRPDIAAAERTLAQANALIGVAEAAYYPALTLGAGGGMLMSALFSAPTFFWSLGASATQTIFEGGLRRATVAQYEALYRADVAAYRQTVLTAFQQVEDQLSTLRILSRQIAEQEAAVEASRRYLELALSRFETGVGSYLDVITAQTLLLGAEQAVVTQHVNSMTAAVSLIQALGGGWDISMLPPASEITKSPAKGGSTPE